VTDPFLDDLCFSPEELATLDQVPLGHGTKRKKRKLTRLHVYVAKAINLLLSLGEPITAANVRDRLDALGRCDYQGNQPIGDILGDCGFGFPHQIVKGKKVYRVPGPITHDELLESFDGEGFDWGAQPADGEGD
jgi:hypothetical protein